MDILLEQILYNESCPLSITHFFFFWIFFLENLVVVFLSLPPHLHTLQFFDTINIIMEK